MLAIAATGATVDHVRRVAESSGVSIVDTVEPGGDRRVLLGETAAPSDEAVAIALRDQGLAAVSRPGGGAALRAWRAATEPVRIRDRFAVSLAWSEQPRPSGLPVLEIGPGGFGSGHHPTTRMLLEELADRVTGGERVLDVGCGSGVLAVAAAHLGASAVVGVDRKPEAVEATRRNADANGFGGQIRAVGHDLATIDGGFDVVVANVARDGIVALADQLVAKTRTGGWLGVSGLSPDQCDLVAGFLAPMREAGHRAVDGWAMQVFTKP